MKLKLLVLFIVTAMLLCSCNFDFAKIGEIIGITETKPEPESEHTHVFEDVYSSDETHHWYACECGEKNELAEHVWNAGVVTIIPTPESDGIKSFMCVECGRKKSEKIAYTPDNPGGSGGGNVDVEITGLSFLASTFYKMDDKLPKNPLSLEAEIYVDPSFTGRAGAVFSNYMGLWQDWHFEIFENGVPRFYYHDTAGNIRDIIFTEVDVRTGDWVRIAFTFDFANKTTSVYLNGELAQSLPIVNDMAEDITMYRFIVGGDGRSNNGNYFRGQIKYIAAYSDVRTAEEIAATAKNGIDSNAEDILVHYDLNPNSGEADIEDLSPNGFKISKEWLDSHEPTLDYEYSFAVIGDTQWLSKYKPEKMEGIYDWILANAESKKIAHVMGLGDITEDWNTANKEQEWIRAHEYISKLNGVVPYSLVRGNHDESKYFLKYFADDVYMDQFAGHYMVEGDIRNAYKTFQVGGIDYLLMVLDFGPSDAMLEWANAVVLAHPNHRVIVTTHGYQAFNGDRITYENVTSYGGTAAANDVDTSVGGNNRDYNHGEEVWDQFISKHPNIFLVLSGHTSAEDLILLQSEGNHGNVVNQVLIDPQWMDPQKDGVGMVCMLYFNKDGSKMEFEWISTDTGKYYQEHNQFVLDLKDSVNTPAHDFRDSYNENTHHKACDCGYIYDEQPHVFDGGVLNAEGFMVYTCECGYQRIASATNDPIALELQALLEKYYSKGVYYRATMIGSGAFVDTFFDGEKFFDGTGKELGSTSSVLNLNDIILGKYGDLKLDIGWNCYEGVYSSSNADTIKGIIEFVSADINETITKVTVQEINHHIVIMLLAEENAVASAEIGAYAKTILVNHAGDDLGTLYTKSNENAMCIITPPQIEGYVAEYDKMILDVRHAELVNTVYYSTIAVWDGTSISESLQGSGTAEDPFLIQSGADLAYIEKVVDAGAVTAANFSGKYFKMTQSIDLNGHPLSIGSYVLWNQRKGFHGFFDGNHCTIRGLDASESLFGTIETGYLKNLSVYGNANCNTAIAGIVSYVASGGRLENLTNYVNVTGVNTLGGVVANAENNASTVINCVNYGNVTGSSWNIGGIAGSGGHDIIGCVNFGNVHSTGSDNIGGIAGTTKNTGKIEGCYNYGEISSASGRVGGIVGWCNKLVTGCINYGKVTASWDCGGVVGFVNDGQSATIVNCVNNGVVKSNTGVGGIFGFNHANAGKIVITGCVNNGSVTGTWGVGGIAGNTKAEISECVNNGQLNANGELGGIVGKCYGKVTECTNNGVVNGTQGITGGIVGHLHDKTYLDIINTTNYQEGTVTGLGSQEIIGKIAE